MCHCEEAAGRRGNLGKAVTISPVAFPRCSRVLRDCTPRALPRASRSGRHVGLRPPRNDNSGAFTILTSVCTSRQYRAGPGCPLPYNARVAALKKQAQGSTSLRHSLSKKSLRAFSPSCSQNCKISFCVFILQFCRCGGLLNAKGNPDGFLSHYLSLRNFRLSSFFDSLRRRGAHPCAAACQKSPFGLFRQAASRIAK